MFLSIRVLSCLWTLVLALPALAQSQAPAQVAPRIVHRLEGVVVSATRVETESKKVASSVTVITGEELRRKQRRLVTDALREVPGVDVRQSGGPGTNSSIFLRGADSDHTLVVVDGIELNDPAAPSRVPFLNHLTTDDVERIEILRGPQSTVWGSDAIGGVIHIVTRRGEGPLGGSVWAEGGSYDTARTGFSAAGSQDWFSYSLAGSYTDSDPFSATAASDEKDPYRNVSGSARFGFDFSDAFSIDVVARHADARVDFDAFGNERGAHTRAKQSLGKFEPRLSLFDGRWEQTLSLRHSRHDRDTESFSRSDVTGSTTAVEWRNDLRLIDDHVVSVGFEGEWDDGDFEGFDSSSRTLSFYLQDQFTTLNESLFGTFGLRVDDHSDFGTKLTYRIATGYHVRATDTTLRASFGTGFKAPSLNEIDTASFGGNPDLDPEESKGLDFGIEQSLFSGRVRVGATYFQNWIDQLILAVFVGGGFLNVNIDEVRTRGAESFFEVEAGPNVTLRGSYTYTKTEARGQPVTFGLSEGSSLLRRPAHKANLDAVYTFLEGRGDVTVGLVWTGGRSDIDPVTFATVRADDHLVGYLTGSVRIAKRFRVFARIENLFDKNYQEILGFNSPEMSAYGGVEVLY